MEILRFPTASHLLARAGDWLLTSEAENNVILGVAGRCANDPAPDDPAHYWAGVISDGEICGCAFRTPPYRLSLTRMPAAAIDALVENVCRFHPQLPGVGGPTDVATRFAETWSQRTGAAWHVRRHLRIHELTEAVPPEAPPAGELRPPNAFDSGDIRHWAAGFIEENGLLDDPDDLARRLWASNQLFVWDDGGPRCMVAAARESPNGACVNAVYTPPINRRRGYASAAVAALSGKLLAGGKRFCCLYTDTANPTSNSIYRRIGYNPIRDDVDIDFACPVETS